MSKPTHPDPAWRAKLRYGKLKTPFRHYTAVAEGEVTGPLQQGFMCRPGSAFMAMKAWCSSVEECAHMVRLIGRDIGFAVTKRIYVYETEPSEPPYERPRGYGISFTPFAARTKVESTEVN